MVLDYQKSFVVLHKGDPIAWFVLVQSLNSPFFPPLIGTEPGRAKEESRITCMRMLRTPPFSAPKSGEQHIWKYFPDSACGAIFWIIVYKQQFLHSDRLKTCQLIPNQWSFSSSTLNHIRFVFYRNIEDNKRNLCQDLLAIKNTDSNLKVHALHYANELMSYLYASDFSFKNSCNNMKNMFGKRGMSRTRCR